MTTISPVYQTVTVSEIIIFRFEYSKPTTSGIHVTFDRFNAIYVMMDDSEVL